MTINRRHLLGASAGLAAAAGLNRFGLTPGLRAIRAGLQAGRRCDPSPVALGTVRPGRRGCMAGQHQEIHRCDRRPGAHRQGKLGGRSPESGGGRQCRLRTGYGHELVRRSAAISRQARRCDRTRRISRQGQWRLVSGSRRLCEARRQVHRHAALRHRQCGRLSRQPHEGGRASASSRRIPRASSNCARPCRPRARPPASRMARPSAMATTMPIGCCGAMAARWSTRAARSSSTAPRRWLRSNMRKSSTRPSFRARKAGRTSTTTAPSLPDRCR